MGTDMGTDIMVRSEEKMIKTLGVRIRVLKQKESGRIFC